MSPRLLYLLHWQAGSLLLGPPSRASKGVSWRNSTVTSYLVTEGHENSETGQVSGTAYRVSLVRLYQSTAVLGPAVSLICAFPVDAEDLVPGIHLKIEQAHHVPWEGQL